MRRTAKRWLISALCVLLALLALIVLTRVNDTVNSLYKRYKETDPYVFESVRPDLAAQNPRTFMSVATASDISDTRKALSKLVYGGNGDRIQATIHKFSVESPTWQRLRRFDHLAGANRYYVEPGPGVLSFVYILRPESPVTGRAMIYHHGFAGDFVQMQPFLEGMLAEGYTIAALNQLGYGENSREAPCPGATDPNCEINLQFGLRNLQHGLAFHIEPVRAAVDLLGRLGFGTVDAVGFSAGAASVVVTSAIDTRIERSVGAAGVLPYYLREGQDEPVGIAEFPPLRDTANMLDLFLLGAAGNGRAQMHLFNRFDRCCFRNLKGLEYEPALSERLGEIGIGGKFDVRIDESHARHDISEHGLAEIVDFLERR